MWIDVLAGVTLAVLSALGMLRGTLATSLKLGGLIVAYLAGVLASQAFAAPLSAALGVPEMFGMAAAGTLGFSAAQVVVSAVSWALVRWERARLGRFGRTRRDRLGGALLGAAQGAMIVLLVGWLGLWLEAAQSRGALQAIPAAAGSHAAEFTQIVIDEGAEAMLSESDVTARVAVRAIAHPRETLDGVNELVNGQRIRTIQQDALFWSYVESGAVDAALNRGSFLGAAHDSSFRAQLHELGLIDAAASADAVAFRDTVRVALREIGPRIRGLRDDPELRRLLEDPATVEALRAGNVLALLADPDFRQVLNRATRGTPGPGNGAELAEPVPAAPADLE